MRVVDALAVRRGDVISFTGAGGKTATLVRASQELMRQGWKVLVTTTTRIATHELTYFQASCALEDGETLKTRLDAELCIFVYDYIAGEKVIGIPPERLGALMHDTAADVVLIEADGARRLLIKAPFPHEPVVPPETTLVVNVVGGGALGLPLDDYHVYNAAGLAEAAGVRQGARIDHGILAAGLKIGASRYAAPQRRFAALLNGIPPGGVGLQWARRTARLALIHADVERVVLCAAEDRESPVYEVRRRVCALVLAAGLSRRMGRQKVLLPWGEETVLEHVIRQVRAAGVDDVLVVTGAYADDVRRTARRVCALSVHNDAFETGEMLSSLQAGLRAATSQDAAAALIVLGDQPSIRHRNVRRILDAYAAGEGSIIAPSHNMKRGHPILIERLYWDEMLALPPGSAPRDVINRYNSNIGYVETDDSVLRDIDTPEAYAEEYRRVFGDITPLAQDVSREGTRDEKSTS